MCRNSLGSCRTAHRAGFGVANMRYRSEGHRCEALACQEPAGLLHDTAWSRFLVGGFYVLLIISAAQTLSPKLYLFL